MVLASLPWAVHGVFSKVALNVWANADTILLAAGSLVIGGALYALLHEGRLRVTGKKAAYALLSGSLIYLIMNFLIAAVVACAMSAIWLLSLQ